jgi:hypothetical protein
MPNAGVVYHSEAAPVFSPGDRVRFKEPMTTRLYESANSISVLQHFAGLTGTVVDGEAAEYSDGDWFRFWLKMTSLSDAHEFVYVIFDELPPAEDVRPWRALYESLTDPDAPALIFTCLDVELEPEDPEPHTEDYLELLGATQNSPWHLHYVDYLGPPGSPLSEMTKWHNDLRAYADEMVSQGVSEAEIAVVDFDQYGPFMVTIKISIQSSDDIEEYLEDIDSIRSDIQWPPTDPEDFLELLGIDSASSLVSTQQLEIIFWVRIWNHFDTVQIAESGREHTFLLVHVINVDCPARDRLPVFAFVVFQGCRAVFHWDGQELVFGVHIENIVPMGQYDHCIQIDVEHIVRLNIGKRIPYNAIIIHLDERKPALACIDKILYFCVPFIRVADIFYVPVVGAQ